MEIVNLSDAEFKTLVIRTFRKMIEYGHKIRKEVKVIKTETKENIQETNNEGKEARIQINDLEQKKERNIHLEQKDETKIQRNEERLRNFWDNFKRINIQIIGVPEGEEEQQEIENLFEKIMKENFPNLVKEIDIQIQEAQRVYTSWTQRRPHQDTS